MMDSWTVDEVWCFKIDDDVFKIYFGETPERQLPFHTRKKKEQDCEYIRWLSFTVNSVNLGDVKIDGHNVSARKVPIQES